MNISTTICWCNVYESDTLINVGPDVLCQAQGNLLKFIQMSTNTVSYFRAETVSTGLYIRVVTGHNRFPLFAFAESVLQPNIFVYKYPEMTKFATLPPTLLGYSTLRFSDLDLLIGLGTYPTYPICVFNYRTSTRILVHSAYVATCGFCLAISNSTWPIIVQYDKKETRILCYEMCTIEDDTYLHQTSEVKMGKNFIKSAGHCLCFGDDNGLYVVNDFGEFSQIEIATFTIKPRWSPNMHKDSGDGATRAYAIISHKIGFLISNTSRAFYIKKKAGNFIAEWTINQNLQHVNMFISNQNGELYAERELGAIDRVVIEENEGKLKEVVSTGKPVLSYRTFAGFKEEVMVVLHSDGVAIMDLPSGKVHCEVPITMASAMNNHRSNPYVVVGTLNGNLYLIYFEKPTAYNIVCQIKCDTPGILALEYYDNCVVFQDQTKTFHVVNVDYRPPKLTHYFTINDEQLAKQVFLHSFILVEGPRLLIMISRDTTIKPPGYADEMWIYNWTKDRRLHRRELKLPNSYAAFSVQPPMGRWTLIEIIATVEASIVFDQFMLNEASELQWITSIKSTHFGHIIGAGITKHLLTWGVDGIMVHFRQHKRSKKAFIMSRFVTLFFKPQYIVRARECYNSKYLIILNAKNVVCVNRLPSLADNVRENTELLLLVKHIVEQTRIVSKVFVPLTVKMEVKEEYTAADLFKREKVLQMIQDFSAKVTALIDYDISVTGKTKGIFKKFCYHYKWLETLTEEARKLCALERESLELAIQDQSRIRDWIMKLVTLNAVSINYKVRSICADASFESYSLLRKPNMTLFDKYRFYHLEDHMRRSVMSLEDVMEEERRQTEQAEQAVDKKPVVHELKTFVVEGNSVYDHIFAPQFRSQDKNIVTSNQVYNESVKNRYYLMDPLKQEFNKHFHEAQQLKRDTIENVSNTNNVLTKIYSNMNCMLRLLWMDMIKPPELTVPGLEKDEVIKCIMEVDDSEVKAINRRRRKTIDTGGKRGRLLLWSVEFWARALIVMMDGVIEKLWEEEIKKDINIPEFMTKKQPHEYTLEDQKIFRAYEEAVRLLELDRRKYLLILHENESKTLALKTKQILKLNQRVAELMLLKLKYDFAIKQNRLRMLNSKSINTIRCQHREQIRSYRSDINKLNDYIKRYTNLLEFWEKALADVRTRLDNQQGRDRALERQFRSNYLNTVPHASHEMIKLFKKRPKLSNKLFSSSLICNEVASKLIPKQSNRAPFPMPKEVNEFLAYINDNDTAKHCPNQVDAKSWDVFVKLRRQKIESELRLKGIGYQLIDSQNYMNNITNDIAGLKETKTLTQKAMDDNIQQYLESMRNMTLQVTLTLGQVEVNINGTASSLANCVLMHVDDINDVNRMIKDAGNKKIKAMERVAVFRRQVIFKEWEHKLYKSNIAYLKHMLDAIEKCKVTIEFLNLLRNWDKVKAERQKYMVAGAIERIVEQKITVFRKQIERVNIKIDIVKANTLEIKRNNHTIDLKIERLKVDVALQNSQRDIMMEERRDREQRQRMQQIKTHRQLLDNVRKHYAHVLELQTILELLRLRTYPTLGPPLPQCHPPVPDHILNSVPSNH